MEHLQQIQGAPLSVDVYSGGQPSQVARVYTLTWHQAVEVGSSDSSYWFKIATIFDGSCSHPYVHIPRLETSEAWKEQPIVTRSACVNLDSDEEALAFKPPEGKDAWPLIIFTLDTGKLVLFDVMFPSSGWTPPDPRQFHHNTVRLLSEETHKAVLSGKENVCSLPTLFVCSCCGNV